MTARNAQHSHAIDLLRFACAVMVMLFHYAAAFPAMPKAPFHVIAPDLVLTDTLKPFLAYGWVGVDIFFVISGYVIAMSSEGATASAFLRRRALRLVPAAWLCATASAAVWILAGHGDWGLAGRWLAALVFMPLKAPIDPSYWTLAAETQFYVLVAIALLIPAVAHRAAAATAGLIATASIVFWVVTIFIGRDGPVMAALPTLARYGQVFALGVLLWRVRCRGATPATLAIGAVLTIFTLLEIYEWTLRTAAPLGIDAHPMAPAIIFLTGVGIILAAPRIEQWFVRRAFASSLRTLGLMTYPLYLLHQVIGAALIAGLIRIGMSAYPAMAITVAAMIALSWLVTVVAEPPLRRAMAGAIDRLAGRSQARTTVHYAS